MKTIADALKIIQAMLAHPELSGHAQSLLGPRTRGSTTNAGLDKLPLDQEVEEMTGDLCAEVKKPGCRYFRLYAPELHGVLGAITYQTAVQRHGVNGIKSREGPHGPELFIDRPQGSEDANETSWLTIILGPAGEYGFESGVVYTWHPGLPLAIYDASQTEIHPLTGVKTHNG